MSRADQRLDALYAKLPAMRCRGLCQAACGSIAMTATERDRITRRHGIRIPLAAVFPDHCPALVDGACSVYADRPLICRTWGMVPSMRCPYGCEPDGGMMTEHAGLAAAAEAFDIDGNPQKAKTLRERAHRERARERAREPGEWVKAACGCIWRESRPTGSIPDADQPRACGLHRADHPASLYPSPQGMAMVPVTYHDHRPTD